ncbi:hypothetical protein RB598_002635 [Gaeumannomyces tritici]
MAFSNSSGGTLTLPSPTGVHHVDVSAAVRSLRRSLSRSPSKFHLMRTASDSSDNAASSPNSPSPQSPCPQQFRSQQQQQSVASPHPAPASTFAQSTPFYQSAHASHTPVGSPSPFRSNVKLSLRSSRPKAASAKPSRTRPSPRSPLKRALSSNTDAGNAAPPSFTPTLDAFSGQENNFNSFSQTFGNSGRSSVFGQKAGSRHSMHLDLSGASKGGTSTTRFIENKSETYPTSTLSPMKRSDSIMTTDSQGSPVAKRRSLHGIASLGIDFNTILDQTPPPPPPPPRASFEIHDDINQEYKLTGSPSLFSREFAFPSSPTPAAVPKRSSSLRKSTLQQRHDPRSSWGKRQGERYLAQQSFEASTPAPRGKQHRTSLDQMLQPDSRESPFSSRGPLPNASAHFPDRPPHQPHPLSRTITTSSSSGSSIVADDSPTHFPPPPLPVDRTRGPLNFAKSLPVGAERPNEPLATPSYKSAKPLQAVFAASTGLVSKMNRNPEIDPAQRGGSKKMMMPDTPCKTRRDVYQSSQNYPHNTYPPSSGSSRKQRRSLISNQSPFSPAPKPSFTGFGSSERPGGLFKLRSSHSRKSSMLSFDSDGDAQLTTDIELPPTPTKALVAAKSVSTGAIHSTPLGNRRTFAPSASAFGGSVVRTTPTELSGKSRLPVKFSRAERDTLDLFDVAASPAAHRTRASCATISRTPAALERSVRRGRAYTTSLDHDMAPTTPTLGGSVFNTKLEFAKIGDVSPASPKTPSDAGVPLDASRLSISGHDEPARRLAVNPPATPTTTTGRGSVFDFGSRRAITPVNGTGPGEIDLVLASRFTKIESIGKGEFSQVFRASSLPAPKTFGGIAGTPPTPVAERLYAVKKLRHAFTGNKDRENKMREVEILKALKGSDNILQFEDSWEHRGHLYIQTEFCEEGSLEKFLGDIGHLGRLDDFRIWKILLEISQGLNAIHDAGFIHLDLKPANILITFDGTLKIGDFGMATTWPAARHVEAEGDREYLSPEILQGQVDKPADIFALGLIILEIATNSFLPDNGPTWVALREGDLSLVDSLTSAEAQDIKRDARGVPLTQDPTPYEELVGAFGTPQREFPFGRVQQTYNPSNLFGSPKRVQEPVAPTFMRDSADQGSLDALVRWMIQPKAAARPRVRDVLDFSSISWVSRTRRAPATVFEGNWGPEGAAAGKPTTNDDIEMMDV